MSQFVCQACESEHELRVTDLIVTAACELCGVLRGDWGWKRVALTVGHLFAHYQAMRRAKLLQQIATFHADAPRVERATVTAR